ncbi:MAG: PAS domain S-box protein [Gammaproteobacteria bacterium]|uniref:sensor histidine kinase n=1 Tax=Imperialibacter sp. TaxID=2038411 RepID=UPI0032EC69C2
MEELGISDEFLALLDAAVDSILVIDEKGIVRIANQAAERLLGYEQAEIVSRNIKLFMPAPFRENHDGYLENYLRTGQKKIIGIGREVQVQRKDGSIVDIHLSVGECSIGSTALFIGIIRDLSEQRASESALAHAEHEIHALVNQLAHVSRVGVMGEMASSIAHEINQPLTAISTYAQAGKRLLESDTSAIEDISSTLQKIHHQSLRAGEILHSMRNWIREKDITRQSSDCNSLLLEVVDIANIEAKKFNIELKPILDPELPLVMSDPVQIQQVALNFIKNSIDAVSELNLTSSDPRNTVLIKTEAIENDRIRVTVTDYGTGIVSSEASRLFDPFHTTKENGMGLGLSICRTIIHAHGGELAYENNQERGVSFYFILPTSVELS